MSIEVAVVLDRYGRALYWHAPAEATGVSLPDSRSLWQVLWEHRKQLGGVAHSHPGRGIPWPSVEDATTWAAVEAGLGRRLVWPITTVDDVACYAWDGAHYERLLVAPWAWPLDELRHKSYASVQVAAGPLGK